MSGLRRHQWSRLSVATTAQAGKPLEFGKDESVSAREGGEAFRDLDQARRMSVPMQLMVEFEGFYTEPMLLELLTEPRGGILALRIFDTISNAAVDHGSAVRFEWDQFNTQAKIQSIEGMSANVGKRYRFIFMVVG